jgi:hypothetical protein
MEGKGREWRGEEERRGKKSNEKEGVRNDEGKEGRGEARGEEIIDNDESHTSIAAT